MKANEKLTYVSLKNVVGDSLATQTTVDLFNSCRAVKKDSKGSYLLEAVKPHSNGVLCKKVYKR